MSDDFVKKDNLCPYCGYCCANSKSMSGNEKISPGALSFCLMCCTVAQFDENMNLIKFDVESIKDMFERNRIKHIGYAMEEAWESSLNIMKEDKKKREKYLKEKDRREQNGK